MQPPHQRAKIIAAEGEALAAGELGRASDVMMAHPLALQLRNLQTMVEIGVDKNSTIVFPAPLMSTIGGTGRGAGCRPRGCDPHERQGRRMTSPL